MNVQKKLKTELILTTIFTFLLCFFLGIFTASAAVAPQIEWEKTLDGGPDAEYGYDGKPTNDGGYIVTGTSQIHEPISGNLYNRIYLAKTDSSGNKIWEKYFGAPECDNSSKSVLQTEDGGYLVCGSFGDYVAYIIKTDANGNKLWDKTYTDIIKGLCIQKTNDGNFVFIGQGLGGVHLVKINQEGNIIWDKTNPVAGFYMRPTNDGGYIIVGCKGGSHVEDVILYKTDSLGNKLWEKTYGGSYSDN